MSVRNGKNIIVPVAVVQCSFGQRKNVERFDIRNALHRRNFRNMCLIVDAAKKREGKARAILAPGLKVATLPRRPKSGFVTSEPPPLHLSGPSVRPQGRRHSIMPIVNLVASLNSNSRNSTFDNTDFAQLTKTFSAPFDDIADKTGSKEDENNDSGSMRSPVLKDRISSVRSPVNNASSPSTMAWSLEKEQVRNQHVP